MREDPGTGRAARLEPSLSCPPPAASARFPKAEHAAGNTWAEAQPAQMYSGHAGLIVSLLVRLMLWALMHFPESSVTAPAVCPYTGRRTSSADN